MSEYELVFATAEMTPEMEDAIYDHYDALIASHGGLTRLTVTAMGVDAVDAVHQVVPRLERLGARIQRLGEDLVSRRDIADRSAVTPQAVGLWVRGERLNGVPFPAIYSPVAGGVWLWGDVTDWLTRSVPGYQGDGVSYPAAADYARINSWLVDRPEPPSANPDPVCQPVRA